MNRKTALHGCYLICNRPHEYYDSFPLDVVCIGSGGRKAVRRNALTLIELAETVAGRLLIDTPNRKLPFYL